MCECRDGRMPESGRAICASNQRIFISNLYGPDLFRGSLVKQIPLLFVLLWSTGFIGTKYGLPYAEPFTFLMYRMYITLAAFLVLIRLFQAHWPDPRGALHSMVVGGEFERPVSLSS